MDKKTRDIIIAIVIFIIAVIAILYFMFDVNFGLRQDVGVLATEITADQIEYEPGETIILNARITNTGTAAATQTITLDFDQMFAVDSQSVTLEPGESTDITLSHVIPTTQSDGEIPLTVNSEDSSDTISITVSAEAFFEVEIIGSLDINHNFVQSTVNLPPVEVNDLYAEEQSIPNEIIVKIESRKDMREVARDFIAKGYMPIDYL